VPKHMGKIIEVQWKEFVQQKTDHKALAISNEYAEMSKKNIYPHHMGSKGYVAKIPEWKKKIEAVSAGNPNPVEDIEEGTVNWLLARSELTQNGKLVHKKKGVAAVQEKAVQLTEKKRLDAFMESFLRCHGKLVFQIMLGATRSVIDTREILKMGLKRK
jgi:uncharacterized HAD superfamily protein